MGNHEINLYSSNPIPYDNRLDGKLLASRKAIYSIFSLLLIRFNSVNDSMPNPRRSGDWIGNSLEEIVTGTQDEFGFLDSVW